MSRVVFMESNLEHRGRGPPGRRVGFRGKGAVREPPLLFRLYRQAGLSSRQAEGGLHSLQIQSHGGAPAGCVCATGPVRPAPP